MSGGIRSAARESGAVSGMSDAVSKRLRRLSTRTLSYRWASCGVERAPSMGTQPLDV